MIDTRRPSSAPQQASILAPAPDALVVTFQLGHQHYGLPIAMAREIVRLPALTVLAGAPPALCGLLNLRGQQLPVLDGRVLVGEPALYDLNSQIVIAGRGQPELGLLVDRVHDVYAVADDSIVPIGRPDAAPFLTHVFTIADGSVLLFNLPALLALAHKRAKPRARNAAQPRAPR